jgi:hypothetical protein
VTVPVQGPNLAALLEGSRPLSALPSPVHEELGSGLSRPIGSKVMRIFPLSLHTAESTVMSAHPHRTNPLATDLWTASSLHDNPPLLTNQTPYKDGVSK